MVPILLLFGLKVFLQNILAPEFSPEEGTFTGPQSVSISTLTPDAIIRYTLNEIDNQIQHISTIYKSYSNLVNNHNKGQSLENRLDPRTGIATATYTIYTPTLSSITVLPVSVSKTVGTTQAFIASPKDQNGNAISAVITWSSSNTTVGTISTNSNWL